MDSYFPLNVQVKLESNIYLICTFLNTFENKLFLIKLKPQNTVIDFRHCVQKKKKHLKKTSQEIKIDIKKLCVVSK